MKSNTPKNLIICDFCTNFTVIKIVNYKSHLEKVHQNNIDDNIDFNIKLKKDQGKIENYFLVHKSKKQKKRERLAEIEEGQRVWEIEQAKRIKKMQIEELLRKQELAAQRKKHIEDNAQELIIIWDYIIFSKNEIRFDLKRINCIVKPIFLEGVFEGLNLIKQEYFNRLYSKKIYKLSFYKGDIVLEKSPGWKQLINTIEFSKEFYEFKHLTLTYKSRISRFLHLTNQEIIMLFDSSFSKSFYLKYLASKLNLEFRIIPIMEFINNHKEESFLFRINTKKNAVLIIWENMNLSRATHIFVSNKKNQVETLEKIEEFICRDDLNVKRSFFYDTNDFSIKLKKDLNYIKSLKHNSLHEYKYELDALIKTY